MTDKRRDPEQHLRLLAHLLDEYEVIYPSDREIDRTAHLVSKQAARQFSPLARWKRMFFRRVLLLLLVLATGVLLFRHIEPSLLTVDSDCEPPASVEQLEQQADLVVLAYRLQSVATTDSTTLTQVYVERVLHGAGSPGRLTVHEPWLARRSLSGLYVVAADFYLPMEAGERYVLFLQADGDAYRLVAESWGKYRWLGDEMPAKLQREDMAISKTNREYAGLFKAVHRRYR